MRTANGWVGMIVAVSLLMATITGCGSSPQPSSPQPTTERNTPPVEAKPPEAVAPHETAPPPDKAAPQASPAPHMRAAPPPKATPAPNASPSGATEPGGESGEGEVYFYKPEPESASNTAVETDKQYTVVKVYYATDRSALDVAQWRSSLREGWPWLAGAFALLAAVLMFWQRSASRWLVRGLTWVALITAFVLGGLTIALRCQPEPTDRAIERMYGGDRGKLELGTCEVSVPRDHRVGKLESPTVLRLEFREDPERHVVLLGVQPAPAPKFYADLRSCIERSARKEAFVFVHGYNVGFETATRRTAQIAYDLKFEGAPIVYSWPSQEGLLAYTVDETNVAWTVPHLKEFLLDIAKQSGAKSVHLIAHSMGNRALTSALRELAMEQKADCPRFHEVVLTAPDIDADVFCRDIAPAIIQSADRVTLYASSNDEALIASRAFHGYRRAGESGDDMVVVPGVDTVDVSEVDTSLIGHSYYGSNSTVLADLFELMQGSKPPDQRRWLRSMRVGALKYWKFLREQIDVAPPPAGDTAL